ncbi:MAG: efflux RND transporter periplasmic adaptor subunit [Pseudomonadota bacterium]
MRLISLLTAILVTASLYLLVFERDALLAFAAVSEEETAQDDAVTEAPNRVSVVAMRSVAQEIDSAVLVRGRTEAARQVDVQAEISGLVVSEPLRKGAYVEAGQLLCQLDPGTREAILVEAEARLAEAEINNTAAARLAEGGFASETRAIGAQATLQSAQAAVKAARKDLDRLNITAPFAGLLESDAAELGTLLQPGGHCATIIQLDPIKLVGFVPETEVNRVTVGAPAAAMLATGEQVEGRVTFLSRSADNMTRTFRVEIEVPNQDLTIRDGQTAEITIASDGADAHLIPASAMTLSDEGTIGVRIVQDGMAKFRPITFLRDTIDGVWVTGLAPEADIITIGQEFVIDGVPVDATYQEVTQ